MFLCSYNVNDMHMLVLHVDDYSWCYGINNLGIAYGHCLFYFVKWGYGTLLSQYTSGLNGCIWVSVLLIKVIMSWTLMHFCWCYNLMLEFFWVCTNYVDMHVDFTILDDVGLVLYMILTEEIIAYWFVMFLDYA